MKRFSLITVMMALLAFTAAASVSAENLVKEYNADRGGDVAIEIWVDNEDGIYYEGEDITIHFRADRDCYVAIYSIDTRGDVNLLFPGNPWEKGLITGGEVYSIPGRYEDYDLVVTGPEGIEYVQAVAAVDPLDIPDWYDGAPVDCDYYDDRDEFIEYINERYFNCRWEGCPRGFDQALIYVKVPRYYYKPVYVPSYWYDYPDYAMIYIDYPYGGEVYINGIFFGYAPLWIPRVIVGYHWFTIYDRYGYCWENRIYVNRSNTIYLDRSRVKTERTVASRYKDIRQQASKYDRTTLVKSDKRVKSVRADSFKKSGHKYDSWSSSKRSQSSYSTRRPTSGSEKSTTSKRSPSSYGKGSSSSKADGSYRERGTSSDKRSSESYDKAGSSRKSSESYRKGSTSSGKSDPKVKSSGSSKKSSGGSKSSGSSSKSSGSYKSGGSSKKSSGSSGSGSSRDSSPSQPSGGSKRK